MVQLWSTESSKTEDVDEKTHLSPPHSETHVFKLALIRSTEMSELELKGALDWINSHIGQSVSDLGVFTLPISSAATTVIPSGTLQQLCGTQHGLHDNVCESLSPYKNEEEAVSGTPSPQGDTQPSQQNAIVILSPVFRIVFDLKL